MKGIKTVLLAKSAIKHNMLNDLPKIKQPTCIIWEKTRWGYIPDVAEEMDKQILILIYIG